MKPVGWATLLFANWMTTPVSCNGPRDRELKIDKGMTLIEAPKSSIAFSNLLLHIMQGTQNVPRSLHFSRIWGTDLPINVDMFLPMLILSLPFSLLLCVHSSLKNFAYLGICLMASKRGTFTSTFLNISRISLSTSSIFMLGIALAKKGRGVRGTVDVEGRATWASSCFI